jgi:hypothetical protein
MINKQLLFWLFFFFIGSDLLFSQAAVPIQSDMLSTKIGLDVFLDQQRLGVTPIEIKLQPERKHLIEYRNKSGVVTQKINVIASIVQDVGKSEFKPEWYNSSSYALSAYSNYDTAVSYDRSRSPNIMFQKALSSAVSNLEARRSGSRANPNPPDLTNIELMDIEILECVILYDTQSYGIFMMVGRSK